MCIYNYMLCIQLSSVTRDISNHVLLHDCLLINTDLLSCITFHKYVVISKVQCTCTCARPVDSVYTQGTCVLMKVKVMFINKNL